MTFSHEAVALCNTRWLSILSQPPLSHNTLKNKNSKVLNHEATVRAIEGFFSPGMPLDLPLQSLWFLSETG